MRRREPEGATRIGLISDTHGLMRPEALEAMRGCDAIVHAGDIGAPGILDALAALAPATAVRGNNDTGPWAKQLPGLARMEIAGVRILVIHDLHELDRARALEEADVVVSGHSHKPKIERRSGVLFVNPGSAGPVRFRLPVSVGLLQLSGRKVEARIVELESLRVA